MSFSLIIYFGRSIIWNKIDRLKKEGLNSKQITELLEKDVNVKDAVRTFYRAEFWNRLKFDEVPNQGFACDILLLAVNAGLRRGIKTGQEASYCRGGMDRCLSNITAQHI